MSATELRERFPRVDEIYARKHGLEVQARRYNAARALLDPNASPEVQARQIRKAQAALDAIVSANAERMA